jgi:hypothetical protein
VRFLEHSSQERGSPDLVREDEWDQIWTVRYLFVPQRKFEAALSAGVKSLGELVES